MRKTIRLSFLVCMLQVVACSHLMNRGSEGYFQSDATRLQSNPLGHSIPEPGESQVDGTYMQTKADYHFTMAESYSLSGESAKAVENYKLALVYDQKSPQIRYRLALEYVKLGLITESIAQCQEALVVDPKHHDSSLLLGGLFSAMQLYDEAMEVYKADLKHYPNDVETSLFVGALYAEKGQFDKSIDHFQGLIKNKAIKDKSQVWYYLGRVYQSKPKAEEKKAESAYITSLKLKPEAIDVVLALGQLYETQSRYKEMQKLYVSYQEEHGSHPMLAERLAQTYMDEDNFDKAIHYLRIVESQDPRNLNTSLKIALLLIEQKKFPEAIVRLERLAQKSPDSDKVRFYLGALYEEIKNYPAAIQQFETIGLTSSYYEDSVLHASYLYKLMGEEDRAISFVEKGLAQKRESAKFWLLYASLLEEGAQYDKARGALQSAVQLFPEDKQVHFQLGSVYDRLGQKDKTIEQMQKVLGLDENHVQALNYLAYIYAEQAENLGDAEKLVRRALELQPGDGFILDTLGWVLFKQNKIPEAIQTLERAHQREKNESIIAEHLGDAYYRHQLPRKAKDMYQKAATLEKNEQNKVKIQTKIHSIEKKIQAETESQRRFPASVK